MEYKEEQVKQKQKRYEEGINIEKRRMEIRSDRNIRQQVIFICLQLQFVIFMFTLYHVVW